jgi:hypothetical protein
MFDRVKGNNTLELNEATLIEAVQLLLDKDGPGLGKVTSVKPCKGSGYGGETFTVQIEGTEGGK